MGWWSRRKDERDLLDRLLTLENTRLEQAAKLAIARDEFELKKFGFEVEHAESVQKAKNSELEQRQKLREQRAAHARQMTLWRQERKQKARTEGADQCRVCVNASDPNLTADEIIWHKQGHSAQ